jgi:putative inorganic carbon (HCO3(-)) transporter
MGSKAGIASLQIVRPCRRTALRIAVFALLVFLVAGVSIRGFGLYHWHDSQRVYELLALLAVGIAMLACPAALRSVLHEVFRWFGARSRAALGAAAALGLFSASHAASQRFAFVEVFILFLLGLCVLGVARARALEGKRLDVVLLCAILAAAAALVATFLVAWLAAVTSGAGFFTELLFQSGFSNVRFLGQFHTLALPLLACACLLPGLRPVYRVLAFLLLALTWTMAIGTVTRGTWFAWIATVLILLPFARARLLRLLQIQVGGLVTGALLAWVILDRVPQALGIADTSAFGLLTGRFSDPLALRLRDFLWLRAAEMIVAHPWTGVGPMMLALDHNPVATHPHNALIQLAAEWGLPAAILLAGVGIRLWWRLVSSLPRQNLTSSAARTTSVRFDLLLPVALVWAITAAAIHAMVDGLLVMPYAQVAGAVILGWTLGVLRASAACRAAPAAGQPRRRGRLCVPVLQAAGSVAIAAACLVLAAGTWPELSRLEAREHAYFQRYPLEELRKPRLWSQGWLHEDVAEGTERGSLRRPQGR